MTTDLASTSEEMTILNETIVVQRPLQEVFSYVADFSTCEQWDSSAISSTRIGSGPLGVGSRFKVVCALPIGKLNLEYEVLKYTKNREIVLLGSCRFFDVEDTIRFTARKSATELDYTAAFDFKGPIRSLAPSLEAGLTRMGYASIQEGLKSALEDNFSAPGISRENARSDRFLPSALSQFSRSGYRRSKPRWNPVSAYMGDKHVVITGATAGLGKATALTLARMGAHLTLVVRDPVKGRNLVEHLSQETGNNNIELEIADLSLMQDVSSVVKALKRRGRPIDVLINNAGALFSKRTLTGEGLEQSFALLLLSPYRLTEGLLPLLKKATSARVVNVVSGGLYSQKLDVENLQSERGKYSGSTAYALNKRALMVKTEQWAKEWDADGITVNAMHPGWADTPGVQSSLPGFHKLTKTILRSPEEGADTIVWLAAATEAGKKSGQLFLDREPRTTHLLKSTRESATQRERLQELLVDWPSA